jgi:hypothetical protein
MIRIPRMAATAAGVALAVACGAGTDPTNGAQVTFNLSTTPGAAAGLALLSDTQATATDTLVLDQVQLVLRDIRFKRVEDSGCEDDSTEHDVRMASLHDGGDDGHDGVRDACESFNAGPFLLDLPLGPGVSHGFSVVVDTGTYDQLRIKLHKPEDDSGDPKDVQFLADHPDFNRISIRVTGSFNGTPFTFESDVEAEQRMDLVPPLVVAGAAGNVDVTIQVDLSTWFQDGAGNLLDPASANAGGANQNLVTQNILDSFHAFRDDNRDGEDDDHEGHH